MRKLSSALASAILLLGGAPALADGFSPQPLGATLGAGVLTALGVAKNTSGGVVLLNGSPTSGDLLQWSATGAQDTGVALSAVAQLGAGQTFSAANTFSGAVTHSGSALFSGGQATFSANNQTVLMGGSTAPTFSASYSGSLAIGGGYTTPGSMAAVGQAAISVSAGNGLVLQGKSTGGYNEVSIYGGTGNWLGGFGFYGIEFYKLSNPSGNKLIANYNGVSLGTGGGTIGANQNGTYYVSFTASSGGGAQVVNLPTANADWTCELHDRTSAATIVVVQTNATASASSATFTPYSRTTGLVTTWPGADLVTGTCWAG